MSLCLTTRDFSASCNWLSPFVVVCCYNSLVIGDCHYSLFFATIATVFNFQVLPWPLLGKEEVSGRIRRRVKVYFGLLVDRGNLGEKEVSGRISHLLEGPFASFIDRGALNRATQLAFALLRSLELQGDEIIRKESRTQVRG